jgi:ABC-type branched-subunit amino acid transport system ATPase component
VAGLPALQKKSEKGAVLEVRRVCKTFGGVVAGENIDMRVESGMIHGLIGPNGAGKSTLLNLISGIYLCDSGQIFMNGQDITKTPSHRRARMGMARTFQTPRFLQRSNIWDNLMLGEDLADQISPFKSFLGEKSKKFEKNLAALLDIAEFSVDLDEDIVALPYGKQKLLEIIRAMLSRPKLMMIDEPAAGLNGKERERAVKLIQKATDGGTGVILIEHSLEMVMSTCDVVTVLNFGKVIAHGTPDEVSKNEIAIDAYLGRKRNA